MMGVDVLNVSDRLVATAGALATPGEGAAALALALGRVCARLTPDQQYAVLALLLVGATSARPLKAA